jgi:hypothetical protein
MFTVTIAPVTTLSRTDPMQTGLHWATAAASVNLALITGTSQERAVVYYSNKYEHHNP